VKWFYLTILQCCEKGVNGLSAFNQGSVSLAKMRHFPPFFNHQPDNALVIFINPRNRFSRSKAL
jgi:hypothetical protein